MTRQSIFIIASCLMTALASAQPLKDLSAFQNLEGIWKMGSGDKSFFEDWQWISPYEIAGKSFKLKGADTIVFERTRILQAGQQINYLATVSNQNQGKEIAFGLQTSANHIFIFENLQHDFPQRVVYHLVSKDSLHAWVESMCDGKKEKEEYYYSRLR